MNIKEASKILVLDPIHGANVIAEELKELGKEVKIFNPYQNASQQALKKSSNFKGLNFDLVISPVHLNPNFEIIKQSLKNRIPFMTHHEAVKEIAAIKNLFDDIKVIEVTGTIGKTSTCELIHQLVRNKSVLLSTSSSTRFLSTDRTEPHGLIFPWLSGTPANVLKVMELSRIKNLKPDIAVFEVSLGLTGIGDVGVITSMKEDYRIAGGTKDASAVKKASLQNYSYGKKNIIVRPRTKNNEAFPEEKGVNKNIFGEKDTNLWIEGMENISLWRSPTVIFNRLRTITGDFIKGETAFKPFDFYMSTEFYRGPLEAAFCTVLSLGIEPEVINTDLSPVVGRMKLEKIKGRFLIDNSNSGTKLKFLDEIIKDARRISENMILIVGAESEYVCEGVNMEELNKVVEEGAFDFYEIIIVGEEFKQKIEGKNVVFSPHLNAALEKAIDDSREGFVIISNVKTWR